MEFPGKFIVRTEDETHRLAEEFSETLKPGDIVVLNGNLGTGKTFFIKSVLKNLNAKEASSPTFAIVNEYDGKYKFYHLITH